MVPTLGAGKFVETETSISKNVSLYGATHLVLGFYFFSMQAGLIKVKCMFKVCSEGRLDGEEDVNCIHNNGNARVCGSM